MIIFNTPNFLLTQFIAQYGLIIICNTNGINSHLYFSITRYYFRSTTRLISQMLIVLFTIKIIFRRNRSHLRPREFRRWRYTVTKHFSNRCSRKQHEIGWTMVRNIFIRLHDQASYYSSMISCVDRNLKCIIGDLCLKDP